ncbi:MAG: T9SS type A sorting domain-containing protein [Bacteroidota bacterium]
MKRCVLFIMSIAIGVLFVANESYSQIEQFWAQRYTSSSKNIDKAKMVKLDQNNNVIVGGTANGKFAVHKYNPAGTKLWTVSTSAMDTLADLAIDMNNNIVAVGVLSNQNGYNFAVVKINNDSGTISWSKFFDASGNEFATAVATDTSANIYVTGYRIIGAANQRVIDMYTVKYVGATGDTVYTRRYNNGSSNFEDFARDIVYSPVDNSIVITGETFQVNQNFNYHTMKYGALAGDSMWVETYHNSQEDNPAAMTIDATGNIYVTGSSLGTIQDYATVKYNISGTQQWAKRYVGSRTDYARAIMVDASNNVYVTGASFVTTEHDVVTIKYNSSGVAQWTNTYNGSGGGKDDAYALGSDPYGNIIVAGSETGSTNNIATGTDCLVLMLSPATGALRKANSYTGVPVATDTIYGYPGSFYSVAIDQNTGAVYAAGADSGSENSTDFILIKYESRNAIKGFVKRDADGDTLTTADQKYLAGAKLVLDSVGIRLDSVNTNSSGSYSFPLVFDGTYRILLSLPDEGWQSLQSIAGSGGVSQIRESNTSIIITVAGSQTDSNNNFIGYNAMDTTKYRTFTNADFKIKKGFKLSKKGVFLGFPNGGNVRDTIFAREYPKGTTKKFIVGVVDSPLTRWWVYLKKTGDVQKIYPLNGKASFFVLHGKKDAVGSEKISQKTSMTSAKHNNNLGENQVTLKLNLIASKDTISPPGLANLIYDDGSTKNKMNGYTVGQIANIIDSLLTFRGRPLASMGYDTILASTADSVAARINRAFYVKADTIKDTVSLLANSRMRIGGGKSISEVSYMRANPNPSAKNEISFASVAPSEFELFQNYPNPFNPATTISFALPSKSLVTVKIYNVLGQVVRTVLSNEELSEGAYDYNFDASTLASGVYFMRFEANAFNGKSFTNVKKMMLLK